jgi:hypothetical protein
MTRSGRLKMPVLSGTQLEKLTKLLVSFDKIGLRRVVLVSLERRLDTIINEDQAGERLAFDLISWADTRRRSARRRAHLRAASCSSSK